MCFDNFVVGVGLATGELNKAVSNAYRKQIMKRDIFGACAVGIFTSVLVACGGGGGGGPIAPTTVTVTCPNGTSKSAATADLANALCAVPVILSVTPVAGVVSVSVDTFVSVDVTTDSTLDASSINSINVTLKSGLNSVTGSVSSVGTKAFRFTPSGNLNYGQAYAFTAEVKDSLGRVISVSSTFTMASVSCVLPQVPNSAGTACEVPVTITCPNGSSQTAATADLARAQCALPLLLSISPANGATAVSADTFTSADVTTDSTIDASSITAVNITLKAGASAVAGTVSAVGTKAFKFTPAGKLYYGQAYALSAAVKDTLGRTLLINSSFATASIACIAPQVPNSAGTACVVPSLFSATPILLPDLRGKYDALCGNQVMITTAFTANLVMHTDGKKDLVLSLLCLQPIQGQITTEPVKNGMIVFIQQQDGSFRDGTRQVFGVDIVDLGGQGVNAVLQDFNKDGYDDIVFSVSKEDGRAQPVSNVNAVQNTFITSNSNGTYIISKLGPYSWNYGISLIDNEFNNSDIVSTPIGYDPKNAAWRYFGGWQQLTGYGWTRTGSIFFKRNSPNEASQIVVTPAYDPWPNVGVDLYTRSSSSAWARVSGWSVPGSLVPWIAWNGDVSTTTMISLNGKDYVAPSLDMGCQLRRKKDEQPIAIKVLNGYEVLGGYKGQVLNGSAQSGVLSLSPQILAFNVSGNTLTKIDVSFANIISSITPVKFVCEDLNGLGYDDIVMDSTELVSTPSIYKNDGQGNFSFVNLKSYPKSPTNFNSTTFIYEDVDGDGIRDLIYFPRFGLSFANTVPVQYQLYKGQRKIAPSDLQ